MCAIWSCTILTHALRVLLGFCAPVIGSFMTIGVVFIAIAAAVLSASGGVRCRPSTPAALPCRETPSLPRSVSTCPPCPEPATAVQPR